MQSKMKLYIGLLVVGLAVVGTGLGLMLTRNPGTSLPTGNPLISSEINQPTEGYKDQLFIYQDGQVVRIKAVGPQNAPSAQPATRTWSKGTINQQKMTELEDLVGTAEFSGLIGSRYLYGDNASDQEFTLVVDRNGVLMSVEAYGYPTSEGGTISPYMPSPLDEIFARLRQVAESTKEVVTERITE